MRVRPDIVSYFFDVLAVVELLFYSTLGVSLFQGSIIAVLLLVVGVTFDPIINKGGDEIEETDEEDARKIGLWTFTAILIFYVLASFVPSIPPQYKQLLAVSAVGGSVTVGALFVIQIAVSESEFFHRFLTNLIVSRLGALGFPAIGGIGVVYHFAVYGDSPNNLFIIFGAFTALSYVAWKTGRISPVILAHVINNALASGLISLASLGIPSPQAGLVWSLSFPTLVYGISSIALLLYTIPAMKRASP